MTIASMPVPRSIASALVGSLGTGHRHHSVTDELLDRRAVPHKLVLDPRVIAPQDVSHGLGIGAVSGRRRTDQVDEEDRHDLALFALKPGLMERSSAVGTEP